jgi:hypothetical protein
MQGVLLVTAVDSLQLIVLTKGQRTLGIPDFPYVYIDVFVRTVAITQMEVPLIALMAMMCPPGLEGMTVLLYLCLAEVCCCYRCRVWFFQFSLFLLF